MLKREKRSGIIFNASIAADFVLPCNAIYTGSKSFVDKFARCLAFEHPGKIDVLSYKPSRVSSNLFKVEPRFDVLTPTQAASSAMDKLGWDTETQGHWRHVLTNAPLKLFTSILPEKTSMEILRK